MDDLRNFEIENSWRELVVWGSADEIRRLVVALDEHLPTGWKRNPQAEKQYRVAGGTYPSAYCYAHSVRDTEVWLWLNQLSGTRLVGGNVIPKRQEGYWSLVAATITAFRERVLKPAADESGVRLVANQIGAFSRVPSSVMEALWQFVEASDPGLPLPPAGLTKWRAFVIRAFREPAVIEESEFATWLRQLGWPEAPADELASRFRSESGLLSEYEEQRRSA